MKKPILCLDFDGVIHSYTSGWQGAAIIPDRPVPGAMEFICQAVEQFRVVVYSSRSGQPGGVEAMEGWLLAFLVEHADSFGEAKRVFDQIEWPLEKPSAMVTIDDRAITFTGTWPTLDELKAFRPWNKPAPPPEPPPVEFAPRRESSMGGSKVRSGYD